MCGRGRIVIWIWLLCMLLSTAQCVVDGIKLKIARVIDDSYSQVPLGVQERAGHNLTLSCDLFSGDNSSYDDQIAWGKALPGQLTFKNETDLETLAKKKSRALLRVFDAAPGQQQAVNRAVKTFTPLHVDDGGTYFCGSLKYMRFKVVYIVVTPPNTATNQRSDTGAISTHFRTTTNHRKSNLYCNERMFKCKSSDACISQRFVCDRKRDCLDGSDESPEHCGDEPCLDKFLCDERCIPTAWCCERHVDPNCTVAYRPDCCQLLSHVYDEPPDYLAPYNMTSAPTVRAHGGRYVFITLCILATFLSMLLMLLILSKIFMLAKKARCRENRLEQMYLDECAAHLHHHHHHHHHHFPQQQQQQQQRTPMIRNYNYRARIVCSVAAPPIGGSDGAGGVDDALLVLSDDMLQRGGVGIAIGDVDDVDRVDGEEANGGGGGDSRDEECPPSYTDVMSLEPPPPYTSQDCLNRN